MILTSGGEFGFPGGHIERTDRSVIDGLNRELTEEIHIKRKYHLNQDDHLMTLVHHNPPFVEHFYTRQVSYSDLLEIEKKVPSSSDWGIEVSREAACDWTYSTDLIAGVANIIYNTTMQTILCVCVCVCV